MRRKLHKDGLEAFERESFRLRSLIDSDPQAAIREARALPSDTPIKGVLYTVLKAGVLVDAG